MEKYGCFFSKAFFKNIFKHILKISNENFKFGKAKDEMIKNIENIFYSRFEKMSYHERIDKVLQLRRINEKYKKNWTLFKKNHNNDYYKYYKFSVYNDLDKEEEDINEEIRKEKERIEEFKEKKRRLRELEKELFENENKKETKKKSQVVNLRMCNKCTDICLICKGSTKRIVGNGTYHSAPRSYKAHQDCIEDEHLCAICGKNKGNLFKCTNMCESCNKSRAYNDSKCYYCKKYLYE